VRQPFGSCSSSRKMTIVGDSSEFDRFHENSLGPHVAAMGHSLLPSAQKCPCQNEDEIVGFSTDAAATPGSSQPGSPQGLQLFLAQWANEFTANNPASLSFRTDMNNLHGE
jgi:hypothetical protein